MDDNVLIARTQIIADHHWARENPHEVQNPSITSQPRIHWLS